MGLPGKALKEVSKNTNVQQIVAEAVELIRSQKLCNLPQIVVDFSQVGESLLLKAHSSFIQSRDISQIALMIAESSRALAKQQAEESGLEVGYAMSGDVAIISICLVDKPFIINTVNKTLNEVGITPACFLHPILTLDSFSISLSYIEVDGASEDQLKRVVKALKDNLKYLTKITEDFTAMLVKAESLVEQVRGVTLKQINSEEEPQECADFVRWLTDDGFVFLGMAFWPTKSESKLEANPSNALGLFSNDLGMHVEESRQDAEMLLSSHGLMSITKLRNLSPIHRAARVICISIMQLDKKGKPQGVHSMVGLLTSKALAQESSSAPLIRQRLRKIIEMENLAPNSYDYKKVVHVVDTMPKYDVLSLDLEELHDHVVSVLHMGRKNKTHVSLKVDERKHGVTVFITMPRNRFNEGVKDRLQSFIESSFGAIPGSSECYIVLDSTNHVRFYFYTVASDNSITPINPQAFRNQIRRLTKRWVDLLDEEILQSSKFESPELIASKYANVFPEEYQATVSVQNAVSDISIIQKLSSENSLLLRLEEALSNSTNLSTIVLYSLDDEVFLSQSLPIFENAGLTVIGETGSQISLPNNRKVLIQRFSVVPKFESLQLNPELFLTILGPGLEDTFRGKVENDSLNALFGLASLPSFAVSILRAYCCLLWQINKAGTRDYIYKTLANHHWFAQRLYEIFSIKFNPNLDYSLDERLLKVKELAAEYRLSLQEVKDITGDRILRALLNLLESTVRTSAYLNRSQLAFKIQSQNVEIIPRPRPCFEIFVKSPVMEGIHLRMGKVARGGIRWSSRLEDYRSEVLGLVKTQRIKNALIVPTGSKGGFVIKENLGLSTTPEEAYSEYIRGLLSITDNIDSGKTIRPKNVIAYDDEDPYLVVAADKGTAKFSDLANRIATKEFNFWLGDAFASGGSKGYDHKELGITAKGAWESVKRHFKDMGLKYEVSPFTAVGIGDMSGDVFGNGLLLSNQFHLIAAFDHREIFLDPSPDAVASFGERQRLFALPYSKWSDYKTELISKGGGVYPRASKEIIVSAEVREALSLPADAPDAMNGEQLIGHILKAKVDLLWNGGIGTYVKSRVESHADVSDSTNDSCRINADELRVRVVGEGGNLGLTQKARIDFARRGGRVNTDAIDNSGGVDTSDHEVNIKILLGQCLASGKITSEERDSILEEVTDEVVRDVLNHNYNHALYLSIAERNSKSNIDYFKHLLVDLTKKGLIDRKLEELPEDEELNDRYKNSLGLFKPELAVLIAATKLWLKNVVVNSNLPKDPALGNFLLSYFPVSLRSRFEQEIYEHQLAHEIITTQICNFVVDVMGITFVLRQCLNHSVAPITVIKCALAAEMILDSSRLREDLMPFDKPRSYDFFVRSRERINSALKSATSWLIGFHGDAIPLDDIVRLYKEPFGVLTDAPHNLFSNDFEQVYESERKSLFESGLDTHSARVLPMLSRILHLFEMLWTAEKSEREVTDVARVYTEGMCLLKVDKVIELAETIEPQNKWQNELLHTAVGELRQGVSSLARQILAKDIQDADTMRMVVKNSPHYESMLSISHEILAHPQPELTAFSSIARRLRRFEL